MARRRYFRFKPWMLNGHPADVTWAVKRCIVRGVNAGLYTTSTTDGVHSKTSYHYTKPLGKAVDMGFNPGVDREEAVQQLMVKRFRSAFYGPRDLRGRPPDPPRAGDERRPPQVGHAGQPEVDGVRLPHPAR
jgi:hypothetical protein